MKQTSLAALSAIALALAAGSANAAITNGNFNGLAGWSTGGDAASVAAGGTHLVLTNAFSDGSDDTDGVNRNVSGNDPLVADGTAGSLQQFLGVAGTALDPSEFVQAYEGSAAQQTFTLAQGGSLSFQWNFSTTGTSGDPTLADIGFVVIDGQVITLANTLDATAAGSGQYAAQTGWESWSTLLGAGTHTIAFGVVDVGSYIDTSALSVGDVGVSVSSVPESSSLAMFGAGLGLLAALERRRRNG